MDAPTIEYLCPSDCCAFPADRPYLLVPLTPCEVCCNRGVLPCSCGCNDFTKGGTTHDPVRCPACLSGWIPEGGYVGTNGALVLIVRMAEDDEPDQ